MFSVAGFATTRTAASCTAAAIQTTINASADGDTVLVPASTSCATLGTATTWSQSVNITIGITLNGQGAFIKFARNTGNLNATGDSVAPLTITNFNFNNGQDQQTGTHCPVNLTSTLGPPVTKLVRYTANTFTDDGTSGFVVVDMCTSDYGPILIDNSTFTQNGGGSDEVIHIFGTSNWSGDVIPGSANMVYIETNTFKMQHGAANPCNAEQEYNAGRAVFRFNTMDYCNNDVHNGGNGGRWLELYQNQYIFPAGGNNAGMGQFRGGSGLVYSNHVQSGSGGGMSVGPDCPGSSDTCSGTWPVSNQVGRGINGSTYSPLYFYGNDAAIQSGIGNAGNQTLVVVGPSRSGCGASHPGGVCDAVASSTSPPTLQLTKCQTAADITAGCPVNYTYTALAYPYPAGNPQAATPTCTPGTGSYVGNVLPVCVNPNAGTTVQCYRTDNGTPVTNALGTGCTAPAVSLTSGGTISLSATTTLKIVAGTSVNSDSTVTTYTYTITPPSNTTGPAPGYVAYSGSAIVQPPATPNMGGLVKSGTVFSDNSYPGGTPARVARCTDTATSPTNPNFSFSAGLGSSGDATQLFNANSTMLHVNNSGGAGFIVLFNPSSMVCSKALTNANNLTTPGSASVTFDFSDGSFDWVNPNIYYGTSGNKVVPYTIDPVTGNFTVGTPIADFSQAIPTKTQVSAWQANHAYVAGNYVSYTLTSGQAPDWVALNAYSTLGTIIVPLSGNPQACAFKLVTAGTSAASHGATFWSNTSCPPASNGVLVDGTAQWRNLGGGATFVYQLTSAGGTSGSSTPAFVPATGRPDLMTTVSDNGLTWTNVGPSVGTPWNSFAGVSQDGTRICQAFSSNSYGYNNNYTLYNTGQGTGIWEECFSTATGVYTLLNTGTGWQSTSACVGGTGYNCSGGSFVQTPVGANAAISSIPCGYFIHNTKSSYTMDYPVVAPQAWMGATNGAGCTFTSQVWSPFKAFNSSSTLQNYFDGFNHWAVGNTHLENAGQTTNTFGFNTGAYSQVYDSLNPSTLANILIGWQPACDTSWTVNDPLPPCKFGNAYDQHMSWAFNPNGADTSPVCGSMYNVANGRYDSVAPWTGEFICVPNWPRWSNGSSPTGSNAPWRFTHEFNSETSSFFDLQFAISQLSSDGKFAAWTSDWWTPANQTCPLGSTTGLSTSKCGVPWTPNHAYSLNDMLNPWSNFQGGGTNFGVWSVTTPGTSSAATPSWTVCTNGTAGATVTDANGVVYTCQGTSNARGDVFIVSLTQPPVPATFFGLHWKIANFPPLVPSGSVRLWDSLTRWQLLNPSNGVFDFTNLDTNLQDAKTLGVDVLFTLSTTPNYISSDPTNATCNYNSTATGGCGVPTDIAASCTNVNGNRNCDGKVDGTLQSWDLFIYNTLLHIQGLNTSVYQIPDSYEIWNEPSQSGTAGAGTCGMVGGTSWEGTCAQLALMYNHANCIITGRGVGCTAGAMGVPAVGLYPNVTVTSPSSVMTAPESTWYGNYLLTSGATTNLDVAAVHGYTQGGSCCAQPETIITRYATAAAKTSAAGFTGPIWSTEGGWGQVASETDVDLQAAFVTRYYLLGWNAGFQRLYWYSYDSLFGTLWTSGGGLTKAGVSYGQIYGWMVGSIISTPFTATGTVWSGVLTNATGDHLIMWDTAQTCSGGSCTTANQPVASTWLAYQDMTTASTPIAIAASHLVPIGAKPVIFQQSIVTHGAGVNPVILGMNRGPK